MKNEETKLAFLSHLLALELKGPVTSEVKQLTLMYRKKGIQAFTDVNRNKPE